MRIATWTCVLLLLLARGAAASPIVLTGSGQQAVEGQHFRFDFNDLVSSDGLGGTFVLHARGDYNDNLHEYLTWHLNGWSFSYDGEFGWESGPVGGFSGTASYGGPYDFVVVHGLNDIEFQRTYQLTDAQLQNVIGTGSTLIDVQLDRYVDLRQSPDPFVNVKLAYNTVPEPGSLVLTLTALCGIAGWRWRRKNLPIG